MKSGWSIWIAGFVLVIAVAPVHAEPLWLVTPAEVAEDAAWVARNPEPLFKPRTMVPGSPDIQVMVPASLAEPLRATFPIQVAFKAKEGASIKPDSFRALYGFLKVDITDRLVGRAKVGPAGLSVESANIPAGSHKLILRVSDDRDRQGEAEIRFSVQ